MKHPRLLLCMSLALSLAQAHAQNLPRREDVPPADQARIAAEWNAALREAPAEERDFVLLYMINQGWDVPPPMLDALLTHPDPKIRETVATSARLNASQVRRLLTASPERSVRTALILGPFSPKLDATSVGMLLAGGHDAVDQALLTHDAPLTAPQRKLLAQRKNLLTRWLVARIDNPGAMPQLERQLLASGSADDLQRWVKTQLPLTPERAEALLTPLLAAGQPDALQALLPAFADPTTHALPEPLATRLLRDGPVALRESLTMNAWWIPRYTPEQIALVLADSSADVRIGLLRRDEIPLPAAEINANLNHPDAELAFWYQERDERTPTADQIELGLTSTDSRVRIGWLLDKKASLTAAQWERALTDPDTAMRAYALARTEHAPSAAQWARCLADPEYLVRDACVTRPDFEMTQARFEQLLDDPNPNVLGRLEPGYGRKPPVDLTPLIDTTLREGSVAARVAMAQQRGVTLTAEQIARGRAAPEPEVRQAFERWRH